MDLQSLVILVVAAAVTTISALIAFPLLRSAGIVDIPSHRSSHTRPTARGGGLAIGSVIVVAAEVAMAWNSVEHGASGLGGSILPIGFLVLTWCYSAIGRSDDLDSLRPIGRLIGQLVLALLFGATIAMFST